MHTTHKYYTTEQYEKQYEKPQAQAIHHMNPVADPGFLRRGSALRTRNGKGVWGLKYADIDPHPNLSRSGFLFRNILGAFPPGPGLGYILLRARACRAHAVRALVSGSQTTFRLTRAVWEKPP